MKSFELYSYEIEIGDIEALLDTTEHLDEDILSSLDARLIEIVTLLSNALRKTRIKESGLILID